MAGRGKQISSKPASRSCPDVDDMLDDRVLDRGTTHKLALFLGELEKEIGWATNKVYRGHTIREQDGGWLLILRVDGREGPEVAFVGGESLMAVYRNLWLSIHKDYLSFRPDKYR